MCSCPEIAEPRLDLRLRDWGRGTAAFMLGVAPLPLSVFLWMGSRVGWARYFHSLFGMGLECLQIWDKGIVSTMALYIPQIHDLGPRALVRAYDSIVTLCLFTLPFLVSGWIGLWAVRKALEGVRDQRRFADTLAGLSLAVMGGLTLFPLEARHILATKVFLWLLAAALLVGDGLRPLGRWITASLSLLLLPAFVPMIGRALKPAPPASRGGEELQRWVAASMDARIADALEGQIETVRRSVQGEPYFLIETSGACLASILPLVDTGAQQLYLELRPGILDDASAGSVVDAMLRARFVLVREIDFQQHLAGAIQDPGIRRILDQVLEHYVTTAAHSPPSDLPPSNQIFGFRVMRRKK